MMLRSGASQNQSNPWIQFGKAHLELEWSLAIRKNIRTGQQVYGQTYGEKKKSGEL